MLALALVVWLARAAAGALLAHIGEDRRALAWALAFAWLAVTPVQLGRVADSFVLGLALASVACAPFAVLFGRRWLRAGVFLERASLAPVVAGSVVGALLALVALGTFLWDEGSTHFGVSSAIARGVLPPVHPLFPSEPFAYHTGYDALVAIVRACTGWTPQACCDIVTLACIALLLTLLAHAGRALAGEVGATLAVIIGPLGYGAASMCLARGWGMDLACARAFPGAWINEHTLPPPVVSSFFQHPQGLGMPLALAALLLALTHVSVARIAVAALLLALLSQAQVVYFGVTGLAIAVTVALTVRPWSRALVALASLACALAVALALGGLAGSDATSHLRAGGYFDEGALAVIGHNLALLGVCLAVLPFAWWRAISRGSKLPHTAALHTALVVAACVAFVVPNVAHYDRSWDIVKFFAVGAFFANVLIADAAAFVWARSRALALVIVVLAIPSGALWLVRMSVGQGTLAAVYTERPPAPLALALDEEFGAEIGRARVLTSDPNIHQLGFLVVGADWRRAEQGYALDRERQDRERDLANAARASLSREDLRALDVGYVLLRSNETRAPAHLEKRGEVGAFTLWRVRK